MSSDRYKLNQENDKIKKIVSDVEFGNYAFGIINSQTNKFHPKYVGRSDSSEDGLAGEIIRQRDNFEKEKRGYTHFKFIEVGNVEEAYHQECKNYHDFKKWLDNKEHPKHPGREVYSNLYCEQDDTCDHSKATIEKKEEENKKNDDENKKD